jgi:6-phosphogluconolactonase/glucosamine-6-phosphate isomerase/deaminase
MRYKAIESKEFLSDAVDIYTSDEYILKKIKAERLKLYVESRFLDNIKKELEHCYGEK